MTELTTTNAAAYINTIRSTESIEELAQMIKQIDALKVALDSANAFRENAIKYAILEAEALVRVVELGGINKLRAPHKDTAEWLAGMPEYERDKYIKMCAEGLTIDQVYKREVGDDLKKQMKLDKVHWERKWVLESLKDEGFVNLDHYCQAVVRILSDDSLARDVIDGTRNAIRKAGGVGIGQKSLVYVLPTANNKDGVRSAIIERIKGVFFDIENIKAIADAAQVPLVLSEFAKWVREEIEYDKVNGYQDDISDLTAMLSSKSMPVLFSIFAKEYADVPETLVTIK